MASSVDHSSKEDNDDITSTGESTEALTSGGATDDETENNEIYQLKQQILCKPSLAASCLFELQMLTQTKQ